MGESTDTQDAVFEYLGDPNAHGGCDVRRIDTHAAAVFLAGDRAFKIKRAVRFPFLDFSTLEKRKAACVAELEVNQSFAPALYRRVVPITRNASGQISLDGEGDPIEWAVEMRRFNENQTFDHLADTGGVDDVLADKLAAAVVDMHARAPIVEANPWLDAVSKFIDQNTAAFAEMPKLFRGDVVARLDRASRSVFNRLRPLLLVRGRLGLIRRGHGDLHLGNIILLDGRPVPFDALEFDPVIASGDVLYDLAFLLMDLIERKLNEAANIVLNRYLAETRRPEDLDALAALPLFMSLRAAIRAKVTAARVQSAAVTDQQAITQAAQAYFRLAFELISPPPSQLIAVGGLSGTGKSSLAKALAPFVGPAPGALVLRSDVERKQLFGIAETEHLPSDAYSVETSAKVYAAVANKAVRIIAARHSVIVDAVFAKADERAAIARISASANVAFRGLFLVADLKTRLERVGSRSLDASDADAAIARQQEAFPLGRIEWTEIDASGSLPETLSRVRMAL